MRDGIIDCCSLLNLYTGWAGLAELSELGLQWYICEAVLDEAEFTREYGSNGYPVQKPLDLSTFIKAGLLLPTRPLADSESDDYLDFAVEVDDGEAQALAIAKHRGYRLLTDDRKAIRMTQRADIAVPTVSTVEILRVWAQLKRGNLERIPGIIDRIEVLARFSIRWE